MPTVENNAEVENTPAVRPAGREKKRRDLRRQALEGEQDQSVIGLEKAFDEKLAAVRACEQQLSAISDPFARKAMEKMIRRERRELLNLAELIELVEQSPEMGMLARTRKQWNHQVKAATGKDSGFWLGAAVVGALLVPGVREKVRPAVVKIVQEVMELSEHVQGMFSGIKEELQDVVSEAQFEKLKNSIDSSIAADVTANGPDEPVH